MSKGIFLYILYNYKNTNINIVQADNFLIIAARIQKSGLI